MGILTPDKLQALTPERGERRVEDKLREARNLVDLEEIHKRNGFAGWPCDYETSERKAIRLIIEVLEERGK